MLDITFFSLCLILVLRRTEVLNGTLKLVLGMFTINPAFGSIAPGQSMAVVIDCVADKVGKCEELLSIEISDRSKDSSPITYKVFGEVMIPGIDTMDISCIFEEHRVCKNLSVLGQHLFDYKDCVGVYGEEEKRFVFKNVLVGQMSKARFKISNTNKVTINYIISMNRIFHMCDHINFVYRYTVMLCLALGHSLVKLSGVDLTLSLKLTQPTESPSSLTLLSLLLSHFVQQPSTRILQPLKLSLIQLRGRDSSLSSKEKVTFRK